MSLVDQIKRVCAEKNIPITRLEKSCGFSLSTIRRWDSVVPGIDKVEKVADVLGCSIDELCGRPVLENPAFVFETARAMTDMYTDDDRAMLTAYHLLSDADKLSVMNLIMKLKFKKEEN